MSKETTRIQQYENSLKALQEHKEALKRIGQKGGGDKRIEYYSGKLRVNQEQT